MASGFFVTGTDTGVGKTLVACALLHAFGAAGKRCVGMKPIAAGRDAGRWQDIEALYEASTLRAPRELVNQYAFAAPIAPHIAAQMEGITLDLEMITEAHAKLGAMAEVVIVEGAGGFMLPLNARETGADLARALGAPLILVVGMRLGCLNHALLTRRAIAAAGLRCVGWVANCIVPRMRELERNIESLEQRLDCPRLGTIAHWPGITAREAAARLALPHG